MKSKNGNSKNDGCAGCLAYFFVISIIIYIAQSIMAFIINNLPIIMEFIVYFLIIFLIVFVIYQKFRIYKNKSNICADDSTLDTLPAEETQKILNEYGDAPEPELNLPKTIGKSKESTRLSDIAYNDRFYEDYRPIPQKKVSFTGNNFSEPAVQSCAALIISGSVKRGEKIKPNDYYSYFERLYGVVNIRKLHIWLYENGYLRNATPKEALNLYKVSELKIILDSMELKKNGNKPDLINRIVENLDKEMENKLSSECNRYFRSEKGERFLSENQDFVMYHRKQYGVMFNEFCKHRILQGRIRRFHDTIFNVLSQKAAEYQVKGYISQLEMIYHNLSESLYDEEKYELSLQYALYRLYFSTNLSSKYYLFSVENVKFDGVETAENRILPEETFNPYTMARILELQPYFIEQMIDVVYSPEILPYCIFEKYDLLDVVLDLYDGRFDAEDYTNYIRACYGKFIKKYL